jgi:Rrf2 family protein
MAKLIKLSEAATLALHAMVLLAGRADRPLSTGEAASFLSVSEAHLSKVLQRLARNGLVKSLRGPRGGFIIVKNGGAITLLDIYEAIEGKCEPSCCLFGRRPCKTAQCIFRGVIADADGQVRKYLAGTRLSDLAHIFKGESIHEKKHSID